MFSILRSSLTNITAGLAVIVAGTTTGDTGFAQTGAWGQQDAGSPFAAAFQTRAAAHANPNPHPLEPVPGSGCASSVRQPRCQHGGKMDYG